MRTGVDEKLHTGRDRVGGRAGGRCRSPAKKDYGRVRQGELSARFGIQANLKQYGTAS